MDIICERCSRKIKKSYLKQHQLTKICQKSQKSCPKVIENKIFNFLRLPTDLHYYILSFIEDDLFSVLYTPKIRNITVKYIAKFIFSRELRLKVPLKDISIIYSQRKRKITLEKVVKYYFLSRNISRYLKCELRKNPRYSSSYPMKLYSVSDILQEVIKTHGSLDNFLIFKQKKMEQREQRSAKIKLTKQAKKEQRRVQLLSALTKNGLILRTDSKLCAGYIDGSIQCTIPEIVRRVGEMRYLYEYLNFNEYYRISRNRDEWDDEWIEDYYESTFDMAERLALNSIGGHYPDIFPWNT